MKASLAFTFSVCLLVVTAPVHASSLISGDDAVFGPDSITIDTATSLEWLDLTTSTNRSYNDISSQFGAGGDFEGWRYATGNDVVGFIANAGMTLYTRITVNYEPAVQLLSLWGITGPYDFGAETYFVTAELSPQNPETHHQYGVVDAYDPTPSGYATEFQSDWPDDIGYELVGHALVRSSNLVPEPSTIALLMIGGIAVVGYGLQRRRLK